MDYLQCVNRVELTTTFPSQITIWVDNNEPLIHTFKIRTKADAQFNSLKSIYVGRNETMDTGEGMLLNTNDEDMSNLL